MKSLSVVHALDMNREDVAVGKRHWMRTVYYFVLQATSPHRMVLGFDPLATGKLGVGSCELDLRAGVTGEVADCWGSVGESDREAVRFSF